MKLEIYRGFEGFEKIESEWYKLYSKLSSPIYSQSPIWHKAYLRHLVINKEKCFYFCIYKNQNLIAIFPLENVRRKIYFISLNTLSFSSHSHFGINSVIVDEDENVQSTFEFLYQSLKKEKSIVWDLIYFNRAIENSQTILCKINNPKLLTQSSSQACDELPIQNYDITFKKFSRNLKRNLKKGREGILEMDNFEYKSSYKGDSLDVNFDFFMDVEASGWKGINGEGSAIKLDENLRSFYHEVMHGFGKNEQMEINALFINNKPVAAQYAIVLEANVFLLKIGYDESCSNLSPGNLLIEYKLKQYVNNPKLTTLNLISDAKWHAQWRPNVLFSYKIYNCKNLLVAAYIKSFLRFKDKIKSIKYKSNRLDFIN